MKVVLLVLLLFSASCSVLRDDTLTDPFYDVREIGGQVWFVTDPVLEPEIREAVDAYAEFYQITDEQIRESLQIVGGELYVSPEALEFFLNYRN